MGDAVFTCRYRVSYADCTVGNHVYYARYLNLLETARGALFRETGMTFLQWQERGCVFPVIECHARYKMAARYDDVLEIETWLTQLKGIRLNFGYRILNQAGAPVLEADTMHICTDLNDKPARLPEALVTKLERFVRK